MSLSIRWRLAIWIALAFVVTMVAIFVTLHLSLGRILENDLDQGLSRDIDRVLAQVAFIGSLEDGEGLQEIADHNSLTGQTGSPFITVIRDREGRVVASTSSVLNVEALDLSPEEVEEVLAGKSISRDVTLPGGVEFRVRTSRLTAGGSVLGVLQVAESTEGATEPLDRLEVILLAEGIAGGILALIIAYWLSRGALKPLQEIVDVSAEIEASGLDRRIAAKNRPAEVQRLADTFDAMLERLDKAFQNQRNFVYDVSHELRTPLTVLRGNIDVLLMSRDLDLEVREHMERMSVETGRLIRLTNNLLYLASADVGRVPERRSVDLNVLCQEVYAQLKDLRPEVSLRVGRDDEATVLGDRDLLKQMLLNLVENGIKYVSAGGNVTLSAFSEEAEARLVVEDDGPGIPPEIRPRIFERFFQGENRGKGGAGIGLAIARWVAVAHGGDIAVESEVGKGTTFVVTLPLSAAGTAQAVAAGGDS